MNGLSLLQQAARLAVENPVLARLVMVSLELAVLSGAVALLIGLLRVNTPRLRALLWLVVLAKPTLGLVIGTPWPLLFLERSAAPAVAGAVADDGSLDRMLEARLAADRASLAKRPITNAAATGMSDEPSSSQVSGPSVRVSSHSAFRIPHSTFSFPLLLIGTWLAVVAGLVAWLMRDLLRLRALRRGGAAPSSELQAEFTAIARAMGLRAVPELKVSDALDSPALGGLVRPVVLLPRWLAEQYAPSQLAWLLRHELMHWKLSDPLALAIRRLAEILFFFHPAVWWAGRKWEEAMELACDRALLHSDEDARHYAEQLYRVLENRANRQRLGLRAGLCATRTQIGKRIASLLTNPLRFPARLSAMSLTGLMLVALVGLTAGLGIQEPARAQNTASESMLNSRLMSAVLKGNVEETKQLIAKGANVMQVEVGQPFLNWAMIFSHVNKTQIVALLLDHKADPNGKDKNGNSPLICGYLFRGLTPEILDLLLKYGANLNQENPQDDTILTLAIRYPNPDPKFIELLLKKGADPNKQYKEGETALHLAVMHLHPKQKEIVDLLIAHGAKVNIKDHAQQTALNKTGDCAPEIVIALVNAGSDLSGHDRWQQTPLLAAARRNNMKAVRLMIGKGADVNAKDKSGTTALFYVATYGDLETVKALVEKGVNVNEVNQGGNTPLHYATLGLKAMERFRAAGHQAVGRHQEVIDYLISKGANPNARNKEGLTPAEYGNRKQNDKKVGGAAQKEMSVEQREAKELAKLPAEQRIARQVEKANGLLYTMAVANESYRIDHNTYAPEARLLTTPVAYLHGIPRDPFYDAGAKVMDPGYKPDPGPESLKMFFTPDLKSLRYYSNGPDGIDGQGAVAYDPSNGTMSEGDIVRVTELNGYFRSDDPALEKKILGVTPLLHPVKVALEAYVQRHNALPERLEQLLSPEPLLGSLPLDPFAPGQPVSYRRSPDGKVGTIYSIGPDGKDDGGALEFGGWIRGGAIPPGDILARVSLEEYANRQKDRREMVDKMMGPLTEIKNKTGRDNAMLHYLQASLVMGETLDDPEFDLIQATLAEGWSEKSRPLLTTLKRFTEAIAEVRKGVALDYAVNYLPEDPEKMHNTPVPNFLAAQVLGKMLCVEGRWLETQGQAARAMENYLAVLTMGRDYGSPKPTLIGELISIAIQNIALKQIMRLAAAGTLDRATLEDAQGRLKAVQATQGDMNEVLDWERHCADWVYALARKDPAQFGRVLREDSGVVHKYTPEDIIKNIDRIEAERNALYDFWARQMRIPYWQRPSTATLMAQFEKLASASHPFAAEPIPGYLEADTRWRVMLTKLSQARLAVAQALYRIDTGREPADQKALVPRYLEKIPVDPFSGRPLVLEPATKEKAYGLWSVGPDTKNDLGQINYDPSNGTVSAGDVIMVR